MPHKDEDGNLEFHPGEMPRNYTCGADPDNPTLRSVKPDVISKRKCKCGKEFILHVKFDPEYPLHQLCDDCIQKLPIDPKQRYPDKFIQSYASDAGEPIGDE